ncbi:MAG: hypothetical protein EOM31_00485 [Bacteroidia bacterium]|nr:hypothetical protein [Bacteroidia bacterium]
MRLRNIDLLKGLLIILVVIGHVIREDMSHSIFRTLIYSFHMPVFIAISGYLFHAERWETVGKLVQKYTARLMLPWVIAVAVYYWLIHFHQIETLGLGGLLQAYTHPYYHLWFVPAFLSWVLITWFLKRLGLSTKQLLLCGGSITLISIIIQQLSLLPDKSWEQTLFYTFRPYFYFYFVLGISYQEKKRLKPRWVDYLYPTLCLLSLIYLYYVPYPLLQTVISLVFCLTLIHLLFKLAVNQTLPCCRGIEWIGSHSFAFYLWHVIPVTLCLPVISKAYLLFYYFTVTILELLLIPIYKILLTVSPFRRYLFGIQK